jgi:hypothetical protein
MLFQKFPDALMWYKLIHVFGNSLGSVLFVDLREQQSVLILFLRKQLNFDILTVAVIYKGQ